MALPVPRDIRLAKSTGRAKGTPLSGFDSALKAQQQAGRAMFSLQFGMSLIQTVSSTCPSRLELS